MCTFLSVLPWGLGPWWGWAYWPPMSRAPCLGKLEDCALENVSVPLELDGAVQVTQRAAGLLADVGVEHRGGHYPVQLSGGEQQRVALARAFALRPPILLADEPTGNLDTVTGKQVIALLLALNRDYGSTLVFVTHDRDLASNADRVVALQDGRVESDTLPA